MNAITLQDNAPKNPTPWLSLVEYRIKTIETRRNWIRRNHRGDTLFTGSATSRTPNAGLAVCVANIVDIVPMAEVHETDACITVFDNAWALMLADLRWLTRKFPVKGSLGIFKVKVPADVDFYVPDPTLVNSSALPDYLIQFLFQHATK
ncbi:hypothetical protein A6C57_00110 [Fibrella sp. ES10-3-2-2]|nr:hypothetical protein A6C57_00110 [Fibrella sp. ES10-3-2-2]